MALKSEDFDFISNFSALWPIVLGALLATVGGLAGGQLEAFFENRRREKDAALFFAEVLSTLKILLDMAADSKKVGDPYGHITMRMLRSAKREIEIYERNRENLYSLKDGDLRAKVHTIILRLSMPLEGVFDTTQAIDTIMVQLKVPNLTETDRLELEKRAESVRDGREQSFDYLVQTIPEMKPLLDQLGAMSGRDSASIERAVSSAT
jgi:hypothetical protein